MTKVRRALVQKFLMQKPVYLQRKINAEIQRLRKTIFRGTDAECYEMLQELEPPSFVCCVEQNEQEAKLQYQVDDNDSEINLSDVQKTTNTTKRKLPADVCCMEQNEQEAKLQYQVDNDKEISLLDVQKTTNTTKRKLPADEYETQNRNKFGRWG